jgi:RNase H-fold protein (predicted Holliday junction resolvase)
MRFAGAVLACLGVGAVSGALGDPPASPPATAPATATSATATATATAPVTAPQTAATASTKPTLSPDEKALLAMGYKMRMRNGEKVFCRRVEILGSRLEGKLTCGTVQDLKASAEQARESVEESQRRGATRTPGS